MSAFEKIPIKEDVVSRTYEIDENLYSVLEHLSKDVYDASINKLVNASIEYLLLTKNVTVYYRNKNDISVSRTFLIRRSLLDGLIDLKETYNISINKLVNIAIRNSLIDENLFKP